MPLYVPNEPELNQVFDALRGAQLTEVTDVKLLLQLNDLSAGMWPPAPAAFPPRIEGDRLSRALAVGIAMSWPSGTWNAEEAHEMFASISDDLQEAWSARAQTDGQKRLRGAIDHLVVSGLRRGWKSSLDVVTRLLLGDPGTYVPDQPSLNPPLPASLRLGPVGATVLFLRGRPLAKGAVVPGVAGADANAGGLIPDLDQCWGGDFASDSNSHAWELILRMLLPYAAIPFKQGQSLTFMCRDDGVSFDPQYFHEPVLPGARRKFRLASGAGDLSKNGVHFRYVPDGQRLVLRVLDEGCATIKLAAPTGERELGPELDFSSGQTATLEFTRDSVFESWTCTCGTNRCDERHRFSAWNPSLMASGANLSSFLWTAVKGPKPGFPLGSFITGMYYALLSDSESQIYERRATGE
jgi:hypothetical protein